MYGHRGCRRVQIRGGRNIEPPRRRFPVRFWREKAPSGRYCPNRRGRGKYDTSRVGAGGVPGRPGSGRGDRPVPLGFAGVSGWRPAFVAGALSAGIGHCSICGPGSNDGRSRTPGHSRSPGKTVDAVALHGFPSPRFRRAGTTATQLKRGLIYRGCSAGFFGPAQKARSAADGRDCPIPASELSCQSLGPDDGSIPHDRRSPKDASIRAYSGIVQGIRVTRAPCERDALRVRLDVGGRIHAISEALEWIRRREE